MVSAPEKPPNYCLNCHQAVYESPDEHLATCTGEPKLMKDDLPYMIPITEPGDEAPF